jgi:thioredoxin reductase
MATWAEQMPARMLLKSDGFASNLSTPVPGWNLRDYCAREGIPYSDRDPGPRVPIERFVEYGQSFQRKFAPHSDEQLVQRVELVPGGFSLTLEDGSRVTASRVVLAVGITHFAHIPVELERLEDPRVTHSAGYHTFERFAGRSVALIGAGASATLVAANLVEAGAEVHLITRRPAVPFADLPVEDAPPPSLLERIRYPSSGIGPGIRHKLFEDFADAFRLFPPEKRLRAVYGALGPMSPWWLKERVEGHAEIITDTTLVGASATDEAIVLRLSRSGIATQLPVEHVVAATGYRADIDRLDFLTEDIRRSLKRVGTMPELTLGFESSVKGLYFVGAAAAGSFGPLLRFVVGSEHAAPRVAARITRHSRSEGWRGQRVPA